MEAVMSLEVARLVACAKEDAERAQTQLLRTFEFVPDAKLCWSPAPSARTSIQIVSHCGMANLAFAQLLRGEESETVDDPAVAMAQSRAAGSEIVSREAAVKLVETATAEVLAALDKVSAAMLDTAPLSPFGRFPFRFWMRLPADHLAAHVSQLEYLQTIWGDLEWH